MVKKITKAVIPAAGLGTRMLPIARTVPKEMLPIVDRPAISYLVEEAAASGITDVLIITNRNKETIENYFDYSPEYEEKLRQAGKYASVLSTVSKRMGSGASDLCTSCSGAVRENEGAGLGTGS